MVKWPMHHLLVNANVRLAHQAKWAILERKDPKDQTEIADATAPMVCLDLAVRQVQEAIQDDQVACCLAAFSFLLSNYRSTWPQRTTRRTWQTNPWHRTCRSAWCTRFTRRVRSSWSTRR